MQMTGETLIMAPRARVWAALNDPEILKASIPGCESIEKHSDTELTAKVTLAIGPMKARFTGKVTLSDIDPPNGYTISGEGQGGVAGFGKGSAKVRLTDEGTGTKLSYEADSQVGGKMAQLGARLIDSTAKKLADQFFARFSEAVAPTAGSEAPPSSNPATQAAAMAAVPADRGAVAEQSGPRLSPTIWIPALIAAVAVIWWLAAR